MIGWIIGISSIWLVGWFVTVPFFKRYVEKGPCKSSCEGCGDIKNCTRFRVAITFFIWPIFIFCSISYLFFKNVVGYVIAKISPAIGSFHDWELNLFEKKEERQKGREEKKTKKEEKLVKTLRAENKELRKKVTELNKYDRSDVLDL